MPFLNSPILHQNPPTFSVPLVLLHGDLPKAEKYDPCIAKVTMGTNWRIVYLSYARYLYLHCPLNVPYVGRIEI